MFPTPPAALGVHRGEDLTMLENPKALTIGKSIVTAMWLICGTALFLPGDSMLLQACRMTFWVTAAAHVVECAIFFPTLRASRQNLATNLILVLIFGVFQYATLKLEEAESIAQSSTIE
jgi:uncharacterized protein YhhL (DUF1145 family)